MLVISPMMIAASADYALFRLTDAMPVPRFTHAARKAREAARERYALV